MYCNIYRPISGAEQETRDKCYFIYEEQCNLRFEELRMNLPSEAIGIL